MGLLRQMLHPRMAEHRMFGHSVKIRQAQLVNQDADLSAMMARGRKADDRNKRMEERASLAIIQERFPEKTDMLSEEKIFGKDQEDDMGDIKTDIGDSFTEVNKYPNVFLGIAGIIAALGIAVAGVAHAVQQFSNPEVTPPVQAPVPREAEPIKFKLRITPVNGGETIEVDPSKAT